MNLQIDYTVSFRRRIFCPAATVHILQMTQGEERGAHGSYGSGGPLLFDLVLGPEKERLQSFRCLFPRSWANRCRASNR